MTSTLFSEPTLDGDTWDVPGPPVIAVEAPYGVNPKTGRPYTKSPEERAAIGENLRQARVAAGKASPTKPDAAAPEKVSDAPRLPPKATAAQRKRAKTVMEAAKVPMTLLGVFGRRVPVLEADRRIIAESLPELAGALAEVADEVPWLARALDGGGEVSPYVKLAVAGLPILVGLAVNHGLIPQGLLDAFASAMTPSQPVNPDGTPMDQNAYYEGDPGDAPAL